MHNTFQKLIELKADPTIDKKISEDFIIRQKQRNKLYEKKSKAGQITNYWLNRSYYI
jgi:hypothetical protein